MKQSDRLDAEASPPAALRNLEIQAVFWRFRVLHAGRLDPDPTWLFHHSPLRA